jgi:hypothetical protein
MTNPHTPGPWDIDGCTIVGNLDGLLPVDIAVTCNVAQTTETERKANAHLIACAPDLLAACLLLVAYHDNRTEDSIQLEHVVASARAAVGKATGKTP